MTKRYIRLALAALTVLFSLPSLAQRTNRTNRTPTTTAAQLVAQQYADSLALLADSLYRPETQVEPTLSNEQWAAFFMPLTYYNVITQRALSLDQQLSPLDEQLLRTYLQRPDMVMKTQSQVEQVGTVIAPVAVTEKPVVGSNQPKPDEPMAQPVDLVVLKPNFWTFSGDYYLQFLQNYISDNWYQGGESNYSMIGSLTIDANYNNKQKVKWDNRLELKLGLQTQKSDSLHKLKTSSDVIRYTGKFGVQATKRWYYTFQLMAYTQWMRYYQTNTNTVKSDFMSPFTLNPSIGMDYTVNAFKGRLKGNVHLAPFSYTFKYVGRLSLATANGIDAGHHTLNDFGSQVTGDLSWKFSDNISWKTRLNAYTTYKRMLVEWENTLTFQFNKYISTKLFVYPRFDDSAKRDDSLGYWQLKEFMSLGFNYSF